MKKLCTILFMTAFWAIPAWADTTSTTAVAETATDLEAVTEPAEESFHERLQVKMGCELGASIVEGNASTRDLHLACHTGRTIGMVRMGEHGSYDVGVARFGTGAGRTFIKNKNNWSAGLRQDILLTDDETLYLFLVEDFEGDEFAGLKWAFVGEVGVGYSYIKSETQIHSLETGFQAVRENFTNPAAGEPAAEWRVGLVVSALGEAEISDAVSANYKLSYAPNFEDFVDDFRLTGDAGLSVQLSQRLSYKAGVNWAYDSDPNHVPALNNQGVDTGAPPVVGKNHDVTFSNLLAVSIY